MATIITRVTGGTAKGSPLTDTEIDNNFINLNADIGTREVSGNKDATGGYAGLTLFKINFKNAANTFTSFFTNTNTAARTYTFPDKDITVAGLTDISGGNAATATTLQNARTIDGVSFNGSADVTVIAPGTHAATSKTTPIDADELAIVDTAASNVLKKVTWANLKATLKTYTDTLYAALGANTFTGNQIYSDNQNSRAMFIDCGYVFVDKGNSGTTTQTLDYTAGSHQKITATGNFTIATSNFPPTGNLGEMLLELVNGGAYILTLPSWNWIKPDGTTTTSIATYLAANTGRTVLQSSGTDFILIWSRDGGTTMYAKLV